MAELAVNNEFTLLKKEIEKVIEQNQCTCVNCKGSCNYSASVRALKFIDSVIDNNIAAEFKIF
ncbi:MAG: hypothetical protein ACPH9Q_07445, partial [Schleiferiaceae bacterium]